MNDSNPLSSVGLGRRAWNKGKMPGPKPPLRQATFGQYARNCIAGLVASAAPGSPPSMLSIAIDGLSQGRRRGPLSQD